MQNITLSLLMGSCNSYSNTLHLLNTILPLLHSCVESSLDKYSLSNSLLLFTLFLKRTFNSLFSTFALGGIFSKVFNSPLVLKFSRNLFSSSNNYIPCIGF